MSSRTHDSSPPDERIDALIADWLEASEQGHAPEPLEFIGRHPEFAAELQAFFTDHGRFRQVTGRLLESRLQAAPSDNAPAEAGTPAENPPSHSTAPTLAASQAGLLLPDQAGSCFGVHELLHEIARGGMGIVFKGRDTVIGREVAVKVLQERHQGEVELLLRFVEEAQISGQLQHPGIAPVYELGEFPDRRPYFTMKLIKGETLAKLLAARSDPSHDRPRFLKIFEQVCQTLAYAHSRGVVHRDLKPANIMVGAFGEVQVMDWGLAKVLVPGNGTGDKAGVVTPSGTSVIRTKRSDGHKDAGGSSSQTQFGSILGTLAYMPPEQALGETDRVDQRADVFALGAILCEILTGLPPYTGDSFEQLRRQAIRADLAHAFDRLEQCAADPELVGLARRSLAAEPVDRPADAGVLARALTNHLEGVETRLREAELAEVQARTRAIAERHRRRLTLAFAGAVLIVLAVGVIGTTWGLLAEREARENLRRELFVADLELAGQAWESADGTAKHVATLLETHIPRTGETDLRDFAWRLQWTALNRNALVLKGHVGGARLAAFSPEGQLVTLDGELTLRRWNLPVDMIVPGRSLLPASRIAPSHVSSWAISADARFIALGAGDTVTLFDARTGGKLHDFTLRALVNGIGFSHAGDRLAAVWSNGAAVVWDAASRKEVAAFQLQNDEALTSLKGLGLAPGGESLLVVGYPKGNDLTRLRVGEDESPGPPAHSSTVYSIAMTADGRWSATGDANGYVALWNGGTCKKEGETQAHHGIVSALAFSPDDSRLATGGDDGVVTVCHVPLNTRATITTFKGHRGRIHALGFDPDGRRLASASDDGSTRVWDLDRTGQSRVLGTLDLPVFSVVFSGDGRRLAAGTGDDPSHPGGIARVWKFPSGKLEAEFPGATERVLGLAFTTPDGGTLATGGYDSQLHLWDVASQRELGAPWPGQVEDPPDPFRRAIGSLAVSPDGAFVAAGFGVPTYHHPDYEQSAAVWNLATGKAEVLPGHFNNIPSVAFSRDGKLLATAGDDQQVKLWAVPGWRNIRTLPGTERFKAVTFSPDGRWVVTGADSGTITIWETATGSKVRELRGHANAVQHLEFSPDGRTLASASWDNTVKLWEPLSGRETRTLHHRDWISCLAFSPDGNTLATGSFDATVRLWEAAPLAEITAALAADKDHDDRRVEQRRLQEAERRSRPALSLAPERLDGYTGNYPLGRTIRRDGDHLTIQPVRGARGAPVAIYPESEKEFFSRDHDLDVTFLQDDEGHITGVIIHHNGRSFESRKLVDAATPSSL